MNRRLASLLLIPCFAGMVSAQEQQPRISTDRPVTTVALRLGDALAQARAKSPTYRQVLNDAGPAHEAVRNAYGQFIPSLDVGGSLGYVGSGSNTFGGSTFNQSSAAITSGYGVQASLNVSGASLTGPGLQKANRRATEEDINNATVGLTFDVTAQYLTALQATAQSEVARQQVRRNSEFLELARARQQVGQATLLDVRQAEVTRGQSEVDLLRAVQTENEAKLELLRRMGVELPVPVNQLALTDSFPVSEPRFELQNLLKMADEENPIVRSSRARSDAAVWSVKSAKSQYLPALSFSAGWNAFTQEFTNTGLLIDQATGRAQVNASNCDFQNALIGALPAGGVPGYPNGGLVPDCKSYSGLDATGNALLPEVQSAILIPNNQWPFQFNSQPFRASVQISLPIFTGFNRSLGVARANAAREDADEAVRARLLAVRSDVQGRYLALQASYQAIGVQESNRKAAQEQLLLSQERFRLGNGRALEVTDAQTAVLRAEADYVNAIYAYHRSIAALEYAVGRPLR
jgi:outer membrane protein